MKRAAAWAALAVAALALPACGRGGHHAPEAPAVHLSTQNPDRNAAAVADFVRDVCIAHIGDAGAIAQAIEAKHWPADENAASAGQLVTVRELEHGRIAYSAIPFAAPGGRFSDCQLELDGTVAPGLARIRPLIERAIHGFSPRQTQNGPNQFAWSWQVPPTGERELTLAPSAPGQESTRPGLTIHVSSADYTLSTGAASPDADANEAAPAPAPEATPNPPPVVNSIGNSQ